MTIEVNILYFYYKPKEEDMSEFFFGSRQALR